MSVGDGEIKSFQWGEKIIPVKHDGGRMFVNATPPRLGVVGTSRLRLPFGRRERLADILAGWVATSSQVKRGTLRQEGAVAIADRYGGEVIDEKEPTKRTWHPGREYNRMGVEVLLRMMRRLTTKANERAGWDGKGVEIGG